MRCAIEAGMLLKAAAAAFSVSPATTHRWWRRWKEAGEEARESLSCLFDRSSGPHRSPRQLAPGLEQVICECRRRTGWGPRLVAGTTASATRPCGRCSSEPVARDRRSGRRSRPTATSGRVPATCCTWTPAATRASCDPDIALPATARSACVAQRRLSVRLRLCARDRRRPLAARLRRAPRPTQSGDRHGSLQRLMTDNVFSTSGPLVAARPHRSAT